MGVEIVTNLITLVSLLENAAALLARAILAAVVPLAFGVLCAAGATGAYAAALTGAPLDGFFSAGGQVGIGVLIALVLERATGGRPPSDPAASRRRARPARRHRRAGRLGHGRRAHRAACLRHDHHRRRLRPDLGEACARACSACSSLSATPSKPKASCCRPGRPAPERARTELSRPPLATARGASAPVLSLGRQGRQGSPQCPVRAVRMESGRRAM